MACVFKSLKYLTLLCAVAFLGANQVMADTATLSGWGSDFVAATNDAITMNRPLILVWANKGCEHCEALEADLQELNFVSWKNTKDFVFCFVQGNDYKDPDGTTVVRDFAASAGGTSASKLSRFPFVCFYWLKKDGTVVATCYSTESANSVIRTADELFAAYLVDAQWFFAVTDAANDRYEAIETTAHVDVRLVRRNGDVSVAEAGKLNVAWPDSLMPAAGYDVAWAAGVTSTTVRVSLDRGAAAFPVNKSLALTLVDSAGKDRAAGAIHFVADPGNWPENPHWVGDYSAADLPWGEWTLDYATALEKVQSEGYLLALFTGVKWCPHCIGCDQSLLSPTNVAFYNWAKENKLALVEFDQPRQYLTAPRLLSDEQDSRKTGAASVSGVSYLSRHAIDPSGAAAVAARELQATKTVEWLAPETTAKRLSNPTFLLIRKDGTVAARLKARENADRSFDTEENIGRLRDLLLLADGANEKDGYVSTTSLSISLGDTVSPRFQINDRTKCYRFAVSQVGSATFAVAEPSYGKSLVLSVLCGTNVLASGTGMVTAHLKQKHLAGPLTLKAEAYTDTSASVCSGGASSVFDAKIASSFVGDVIGDGESDGPGYGEGGLPCFGWETYELNLWNNFDPGYSLNLVNVDGASLINLRKVSGTLPGGVKIKYDKATGRVVLTGAPTKVSGDAVTVTYAVSAKIGGKNVVGPPAKFKFSVANPTSVNKQVGTAVNADVPMETEDGVIAGVLSFKQTARGKITVKYTGTEAKTFSASGNWSSLGEDGTAATILKAKGGAEVVLSLDTAGNLAVEAEVPAAFTAFVPQGAKVSVQGGTVAIGSSASEMASFNGYYTVVLPRTSEGGAVAGTGYLTLNFTSAAAIKAGKVAYAGFMPNGKKFSGTGYLSVSGDTASLAVFKRVSQDVYGAELKIKAHAATGLNSPETSRAVTGKGVHIHRETGNSYVNMASAYGSWYPAKKSPSEICSAFGIGTHYGLYIGGGLFGLVEADSKGLTLVSAAKTVRLTYNKASGAFNGKATVKLNEESQTSGNISGVLNPGWGDCGCGDGYTILPFGEGAFVYDGKIGQKRVKLSLPVTLEVIKIASANRLGDIEDFEREDFDWTEFFSEAISADAIGAVAYAEGENEGVAPAQYSGENDIVTSILGIIGTK